MLNRIYILIIVLFAFNLPVYSEEYYPQNLKIKASLSDYNYDTNIEIESLFRKNLSSYDGIAYTIIPMGVIISINGYLFYETGKDELNCSAYPILDILANLIKTVGKPCLVESSTTTDGFINSTYRSNWELSITRANNIVNYLISQQIRPDKIRANGFGEIIPFSKEKTILMQDRIDFVIFNYEEAFRR